MDGYNNQRNVFCSRPQMPQPPCMNTNCRFSYNTLSPADPVSGHQMVPEQMKDDRVFMSCCGRSEAAGRNEMCMREPRREISEEVNSRVEIEPAGEIRGEEQVKTMPGCDDMPIGMAYVPWQRWGTTYPVDQGLKRGTIFPDLDLPFVMGRCR